MLAVHERSPEVEAMATDWPMLDALMGGTGKMREAGSTLLPKWPNETTEAYASRLAVATLYPAFRRTVGVMSGKPFSKQLTLNEDVPPRLQELADDVDGQGTSLHVFASRRAAEVLSHGICGVLVDFTRTGQVRTLADERAMGARPYFVPIAHDQILGWRTIQTPNGLRLSQLRLSETTEVPDGDFGTKTAARVRVLRRGEGGPATWEIWEANEKDVYVFVEGGPMSPLTEIPFVPFYGEQAGFMMGRSPLLELAHLNVKHYQHQSDQDTILHVARVPILAIIGGDPEKALTVGANLAVNLPENADMKYVEHSGAAIQAGQDALTDLKEQMIQTGAELLVPKPGERSATEANNDAEANKSDLQRIVENLEDSLDQCLQFAAEWLRIPEGGHVELFKDFSLSLSDASAQLVHALQQGGLISKVTAIQEMQRRGILSPDVEPEDEIEQAEAEGPNLGEMAMAQGGGDVPQR